MINPQDICMNCMNKLNQSKGVCTHCGFDNATCANDAHQLESGSILAGSYIIGKVLGQGGFGITYVGWDLNLEIKVAIKEYYPEGCVTRDTHTHVSVLTYAGPKDAFFQKGKERFVGEARALAKFSGDSGVVGVRAFFYENGTAYIVMDFVEGETLKAYAARIGGRMPSAQVLSLFQPLIHSLARVHESGLLHRDISPDNIMLKPDGTLALLDFGAARQISVAGEHSNTINVKHGYAPEEQYRTRGEQGPWTDVYALCATIYRLTTGVTPTEALDRMANEEQLVPPSAYGADFTPDQEHALMHGLALRAGARTRDLRVFTYELYGVMSPAHSDSIVNMHASTRSQRIAQPQSTERVSSKEDVRPVLKHTGETGQTPSGQLSNGDTKEQIRDSVGTNGLGNDIGPQKTERKPTIEIAAVSVIAIIALIVATSNSPVVTSEGDLNSVAETQAPITSVQAATQNPSTVVDWQDPILEAGVRKALGKTNGEVITSGELAEIYKLDIAGDTIVINDDTFWTYVDSYSNTYSIDGGMTMLPVAQHSVSLKDLEYFSGLQVLTLVATSATNWEALSSCPNLSSFSLDTCGGIDLNWFGGIRRLNYLSISNCTNLNIAGAAKGDALQSLNSLVLSNCGSLNGSELAEFAQLTSLSIWSCKLISPEELGDLVNLTEISLSDTGIDNVDFLGNMKNLYWLSIYENNVKSIPSFVLMRNLTGVSFSSCGLDDVDMRLVAYYTNLSWFSIDGCNVSDLAFLSGLTNMEYLSFDSTSVKDLSPISKLTKLTTLWMRDTKITDISVLSNFRNLQTLAIAGTKIRDYSPLANLNLTTFHVDSSQEQKIRQMFPNAEINVW